MGRQRQHAIWRLNIFEKIDKDNSRCKLCPKPLRTTNNTVGSLVAHLVHHPEEQLKYRETLEQEGTATGPMDEQVVRPSGNLTATDKVVLHLIAVANLPFILVEHPVFRMLFRLFGKAELLQKEKHYRVTTLPIVYSRVCARVKAELKKCSWLSFTLDIWSGPTASFISLTASGISSTWVRSKFLLACREFPGSHTGERVNEIVESLLKEWDIDRSSCHSFVHDEGSNMGKAFRQSDDLEDANCGSHMLHTCVVNSFFPHKDNKPVKTAVNDVMARGRALVTHFRHSLQAVEILAELQKEHGLEEHALIQDVRTRWNSAYLMAGRLLEQKAALDSYCARHRRDLLLSHAEWSLLEDVHSVLGTLAELSQVLCKDESPISMQIAVRRALMDELESTNVPTLETEIERLKAALIEKFGGLEEYKTHGVAHLLDPRFKDTLVDNPAAFRQMCLNTLKEVLKDASPDLQHIRDVPRSSSPPRKKSLLANLTNKYARTSATSSSQPVVRQSDIDLEFGVYIREDTVEWEADPLVWWRENSSRFPILSPGAMRFLSTPATSVHSEQIFSAAKLVYNPLRTRLDPKRAEMLIFLHRNLPTIHYQY